MVWKFIFNFVLLMAELVDAESRKANIDKVAKEKAHLINLEDYGIIGSNPI